jgi:hypothetical protein
MSVTVRRKCGGCSDPVVIKRENLSDIVYYKRTYYHSDCFCKIAEKRSKSNISTAPEWKDALDNLLELEKDTKNMLENSLFQDELNDWFNSDLLIAEQFKIEYYLYEDLNKVRFYLIPLDPFDNKKVKKKDIENMFGIKVVE